ncbi:MAG TPA: hypothetical protein VIY08_05190 [Candidatus Nitrosocosmicus sp.]
MGEKELKNYLFNKSQILLKEIEQKKNILIFANSTVDGIVSASIFLKSIFNTQGNAITRCNLGIFAKNFDEIVYENYDYHIFVDFSCEIFNQINKTLKPNTFLFLNTDEIPKTDKNVYNDIINPWIFDVNGQTQISTSGLTYLIVRNFDRDSIKISYLPIISAISKEQDAGKDKSLTGLNKEILQSSLDTNLIEQKKGLVVYEKESMPINKVLENNTLHFIKGITWNIDTSLKIIKDSQILIDNYGNTKLFNELNEKEFISICETISRFLQENTKVKDTSIVEDLLFGYNYILTNEEPDGFLKNARTFEKIINLFIDAEKIGLAFSLCMGERKEISKNIDKMVIEYNNYIKKISSHIFEEKWRFNDDKKTLFINGEGIINKQNANQFISFLKRSISFADRLICLRIVDSDEYYKIIITKTKLCEYDLNDIKEKLQRTLDKQDISNIKRNEINIKISFTDLEDFLASVKKIIINEKISHT